MSRVRHLTHAPIVEALLDLRFDVADEASLDELSFMSRVFADLYPWQTDATPRYYQPDLFGVNDSTQAQARFFLHNHEDLDASTRVLVIMRDGLTVRQIWEYSNWLELEEILKKAVDLYTRAINPEAIVRIATRFFNKIELPSGRFDLNDIFTCAPRLPLNVPQDLFDFSHRIGLVGDPPEMLAWIEHYIQREGSEGVASAILDIDVFRNQRFGPTWHAISDAIHAMHKLKNELFFGSLTDSALERYE